MNSWTICPNIGNRTKPLTNNLTGILPHPIPDSLSMPQTPQRSLREERDHHRVRSLGVSQVPCQRLYCVLWCRQHGVLRLSQISTQWLLLQNSLGEDEVSPRQILGRDHVPFREEPREIISQELQVMVRFLPMGRSTTQRAWLEESRKLWLETASNKVSIESSKNSWRVLVPSKEIGSGTRMKPPKNDGIEKRR